jgi:hypothetical protein
MSSLLLDLRHAVGALTAPTVAVFTLPLAVDATTAIFSSRRRSATSARVSGAAPRDGQVGSDPPPWHRRWTIRGVRCEDWQKRWTFKLGG